MPARSERIHLFPDQDGQPCRAMEFPLWWDRRAFFDAYGHRAIDGGSPLHVDYSLLLTGAEAVAWDDQCRERFSHDPRSGEPWFVAQMRQAESALATARWVIVESYEWESGLD